MQTMSWIHVAFSRENPPMHDTLETLRSFQSRLLMAIHGIPETELERPESEGKWSIKDVIAHLGDLEMVYAVRMRMILSGTGDTSLSALAQDAWIERVHRREPLAELLEQFWFHRRMNATLLGRLSDEELGRSGNHPQYGALTIRGAAERIVNHDAKHLRQIERIKSALGLRAMDAPDVSGVVAGSLLATRDVGPGVRVREL